MKDGLITDEMTKDELVGMPSRKRVDRLNQFIQHSTSAFLGVPVEKISPDEPFSLLLQSFGADDECGVQLVSHLFDEFKSRLDLHVYYFERDIQTISALSEFVSQQIDDIWNPATPEPIDRMEAEPMNWPWVTSPVLEAERVEAPTTFLLSCPRSGSTIFRLILTSHPKLFSPPELHLMPFASMGEREAQIQRNGFEWMNRGLVDTLVALDDIPFEQAEARYRALVEDDVPVVEVYKMLHRLSGGRMLVDKTPFYACHPDWLRKAEQSFANPRYIFLVRHPYGMIGSFVKLRIKELVRDQLGPVDDNPWRLAEKWWFNGNNNITEFLEDVPDDRKLFVKYEDLVAQSEQVVPRICDFLGVDFTPQILNPYENPTGSMMGGVGDPNIGQYNKIEKTLAEAWRHQQPPQVLSAATRALMERFSYKLS